ncbi:MAG: DUF1653 domain-containing protein [Lachnospiraceae bacterium]|nr:DUF1653 domain-containing protein [Lachnospiraceae bacterium]
MPQNNPKPGEFYRHFKNKMYQIIGICTHSETREKMVCYQALYGDYGMYVRPYDMFVSEVDHAKYPEVTQKYRFELVDFSGQKEVSKSATSFVSSAANSGARTATSATNSGARTATSAANCGAHTATSAAEEAEESPRDIPEALHRFLDTDAMEDKLQILEDMNEDEVTELVVDSMAVSLDIVIPEGDLFDRFTQLKSAVRTKARYEAEGLGARFRVKVRQ